MAFIPIARHIKPADAFSMDSVSWDHWYEASDTDNFALSGNDVTTWYDLGSEDKDLTAHAVEEGYTGSVKVNQHSVNGNNVITVDQGWFTSSEWTSEPWSGVSSGDIFYVYRQDTMNSTNYTLIAFGEAYQGFLDSTVERLTLRRKDTDPAYARVLHDNQSAEFVGDTDISDTSVHLIHLHSSGSAWTLYVDGGSAETLSFDSGSNSGDWLSDLSVVAANRWKMNLLWNVYFGAIAQPFNGWEGYLCEVAVKHGALSGGDISNVTSHLLDKWGIS